jgi:acylphosphatase
MGGKALSVPKEQRPELAARRWFVRGRVQGVGFRYFVERIAGESGLTGYARNLHDGRVEIYAVGPKEGLAELAGLLWKGPRWADVRGVEEHEAPVERNLGFRIE